MKQLESGQIKFLKISLEKSHITLLKENKYELRQLCEELLDQIETSKYSILSMISKNSKDDQKKLEYLNYVNDQISKILQYSENNKNLELEIEKNYNIHSYGSEASTDINSLKISKEELLQYAEKILECLNVLNNVFDEFFAKNVWNLNNFNNILYRSFIYPSNTSNGIIESCLVKSKDLVSYNFTKENILNAKTVQIIFITRRKNASCDKTLNYITKCYFERYILRKDDLNNILIKGLLKVPLCIFENYFLQPFDEFKNYDYIEISVFFNEILLYQDYDPIYDFTNISKEMMDDFIKAGKSIEILGNYMSKIKNSNIET